MPSNVRQYLPGITPERGYQILAGAIVLRMTTDRLRRWTRAIADQTPKADGIYAATSRRGFINAVAGSAVAAVLVGIAGRAMSAATSAANGVREAIALPKPVTSAPPIPAGAELGLRGLSAVVTSNDTFYRIDTALQVPRIDPAQWKLRIVGLVDREIEIGYEELLALPMTESVATLMCVSNEIGGNLISNAVKFSDHGGAITVGTAGMGGEIVISVRDEGMGIAPDDMERIFQRFERVETGIAGRTVGTGLGLAIVSEIAWLHHGRVTVESAIGEGSTFSITLPVSAP